MRVLGMFLEQLGMTDSRSLVTVVLYVLSVSHWSAGQQIISSSTDPTTRKDVNATDASSSCSGQENCGNVPAAVIGSLIAGFILGVVVTCGVSFFLRKRRARHLPVKDYEVTDSGQFDVNRNSGGDIQYMVQGQVTPGHQRVKGHKKLERLAKPSHTSPGTGETGYIEFISPSAPLIKNVGATPGSAQGTTPIVVTSIPGPGKDNLYANEGVASLSSEPYEALDIIPEEVEYENSRSHDYERIIEPANK